MTRRAAALILGLGLCGCSDSGGEAFHDAGTAAVAAAIGSAGGPVVGLVAGVAAAYAVDQGVKYGERRIEQNVQNAVARAAGPLDVGRSADWKVEEDLPLGGRSGTVEVAVVSARRSRARTSSSPSGTTRSSSRPRSASPRMALGAGPARSPASTVGGLCNSGLAAGDGANAALAVSLEVRGPTRRSCR
jgi:hypothetical protein